MYYCCHVDNLNLLLETLDRLAHLRHIALPPSLRTVPPRPAPPPVSHRQGVKWIVMTDTTLLSMEQLLVFRAAVGAHDVVSRREFGKKPFWRKKSDEAAQEKRRPGFAKKKSDGATAKIPEIG